MELPVTLEAIKLTARRLDYLRDDVVFLGGCATGLLITSKAIPSIRPTMDIDVIVEIASRSEYYTLEDNLRRLGFKQKIGANEPLCRWTIDGVTVDIMPTDAEILGFANMWYSGTINHSVSIALDENLKIRIAEAPYFIATKIEAFRGRGQGEYLNSHDIEDIITIIDGREELVEEISSTSPELRSYIAEAFKIFLSDEAFIESLSAHLLPDAASQDRGPFILARMRKIVKMRKT